MAERYERRPVFCVIILRPLINCVSVETQFGITYGGWDTEDSEDGEDSESTAHPWDQ